MRSLETTSSDLEQLPSLALGNECGRVSRGYSNCWRLQQLLEAAATVGSCSDCWKLRRLLEAETGYRRRPQCILELTWYRPSYEFGAYVRNFWA